MRFEHALLRRPGKDMADGITTADLGAPDITKAMTQFTDYVDTLTDCGIAPVILPALEGYPDAHFVEDTAVIMPEVAVITNPGAISRKGEIASIETALARFRKTVHIQPPGTLDGGDVLMMERHFLIGLSNRTNEAGARQLGEIVAGFGYTWTMVPVADGLHFKSSVNAVGPGTLLTTPAFADHPGLSDYRQIQIPAAEAYAGNTLWINECLIMPAGFPDTRQQLQTLGTPIIELDTSEFRKMDGGLTCLSLRF